MNPERWRPPLEKPEAAIEREMESLREKIFTGAVLKWIDRLTRIDIRRGKKLRPKFDLGAAFIPTVILSVMAGCYPNKIVECTESETNFLSSVANWISEHPNEINAKMDEIWEEHALTGQELADALNAAIIDCGVDNFSSENYYYGSARQRTNTIIITVDNDRFNQALESYEQGEWTEGINLNDLIETFEQTGDEQTLFDRDAYNLSIVSYAEILAHEAAHLELGPHSHEVKKRLAELHKTYGFAIPQQYSDEIDEIDEIYAWGTAAREAGYDYRGEELDAIFRALYPEDYK